MHGMAATPNNGRPPRDPQARLEKLQVLKQREDEKDTPAKIRELLMQRYAGGPYTNAKFGAILKTEVDRFVGSAAPMTEANLARFERRVQKQALDLTKPPGETAADALSVTSISAYTAGQSTERGVSAGSLISSQRQAAGPMSARQGRISTPQVAAAASLDSGCQSARGAPPSEMSMPMGDSAYESPHVGAGGTALEWAVLDKLAAQMHKQDAAKQRLREVEVQKKLRDDLARQVDDVRLKREREQEDEKKYFEFQMAQEQRRAEQDAMKTDVEKEKVRVQMAARQIQIHEIRQRQEAEQKKASEEAQKLHAKIRQEEEMERKRVDDVWHMRRAQAMKALEMSNESAKLRQDRVHEQKKKDDESLGRYQQMQEERKKQAQERDDVAKAKREQMETKGLAVAAKAQANHDRLLARNAADRKAKEARDARIEEEHRQKLADQKLETQAYLLSQMREKQSKKHAEKVRLQEMRMQQEEDAKAYEALEYNREHEKRQRNVKHCSELQRQIEGKMSNAMQKRSGEVMSEVELRINKSLLERVNRALENIP
eukprot:TRINITY_DN92040_c0_g1_i1.p1 TRINITY_DN92040_c0_g1~~TRINITY_DN92040_c0_g1_i1.p1  ORF type:complete len:545 (+),score=198.57 TRINITY_DN92040_c0_g1_i1:72-1706(+)